VFVPPYPVSIRVSGLLVSIRSLIEIIFLSGSKRAVWSLQSTSLVHTTKSYAKYLRVTYLYQMLRAIFHLFFKHEMVEHKIMIYVVSAK
jgi:hypothetical protein